MAAGCSSGGDPGSASESNQTSQKGTDAGGDPDAKADPDAGADSDSDVPDADVPGGDDDEEIAGRTPGTEHGTKITSFTVTGYHATFDVRSLPSTPDVHQTDKQEAPKPPPPKDVSQGQQGPAQTVAPAAKPPKVTVNVAGIQESEAGGLHPPDTSGAIGPDQFVQTVNEAIGIYDRAGTQLNLFSFNTFMGQFQSGTPCDNQNGGDPQVIFDQPSNRWVIADLSYPSGGPYYFCMAVSDGPDLTSTGFTMYPFVASADSLNDYPKIASGPNGLFLTSNMFYHFQSFSGAEVWAFDRATLGKKKLGAQTVRTSSAYGSLLPANSYAAQASKGPNYLVSLEDSSHLGLWQYKVNWKKPKKSTFTQTPTLIQVEPFQQAGEVPEKDGASVDSLSDRPMYQLQLATDGTLWFDHSVQVGSQAGVRWYQIGNITGTPTVLQQSTYAPNDGLSRWMGSLAVDKAGNMAVGYSTASADAYPSINYATRRATDKKNKLTAEGNIVKGTGSQTVTSRWGDYSQMSLDPNNDCTLWYTQEYYLVNGGNWQTRIASFTFPHCS